MQNYLIQLSRQVSLFVLLILLPLYLSAQQNMITLLPVTVQELGPEQTIRYNKVIATDLHSSYRFVHIEDIAAYQQEGKIAVSLYDMPCSTVYFLADNVEYGGSDSNYYWYGQTDENSSSACGPGSVMLLSVNGEHFGQIAFGKQVFEIFELSGGVQLAALLKEEANHSGCGVSNTTAKVTDTLPGSASTFCKIRILVLYTPSAITDDPNINDRINLAIWQTKQALLNSGINNSQLQVELAGKEEIRYSESDTDPGKDAFNMTSFDPIYGIANEVLYLRRKYNADVVFMLTKKINMDIKGVVAAPIQNADSPYAVVQVVHATNSSYTFVHEFSHILGGRHQDAEPLSDDNTPSIAHAHRFTIKWMGLPYKQVKTIPYGNTDNDGSAILYFSSPDIYYCGAATGLYSSTYGARNTAQQIKNIACIVAGYNAIDSGDFNSAISVIGSVCAGDSAIVYSHVTGTSGGTYLYAWQTGTDGINYGPVIAATQNFHFEMPAGVFRLHFRLTVTDPSGAVRRAYTSARRRVPESCSTKKLPVSANDDNRIIIAPVPARDQVTVTIGYPDPGKAEILLLDPAGRVIKSKYIETLLPGKQEVIIDTRELQPGLYLLRLQNGQLSCNRKLVINH